jgi:phage terminase large subunit
MSQDVEIILLPRKQFRPYLARAQRFACVVAHRRAGKTFACVQDLLRAALSYERPGPPCRYAYIAPTRDQAKDIAWPYLLEFSGQIPGTEINRSELMVTYPNQSTVRLYSGDNYDRMRGLYFDGVVIDEPADIDPDAWPYVILPCLSDYSGWATFIGTCKGRNAFYRIYRAACSDSENWFTLRLMASESGLIPESELKTLRANMTDAAYRQEYECDWSVGVPGAIYARFVESARNDKRIDKMPVDGGSPVHTAWDLGSPMNTVVWYFQLVGRMIRIVACDRGIDETIVHRVARMRALGWPFGDHFLPHDAEQTERSGRTLAGELRSAGLTNVRIVPRTTDIWVGINHACQLFPSLEFRLPDCDSGLESLEAYHTKEVQEGAMVTSQPVHDWSSHAADAFRTMAEAHHAGMISRHGLPIPGADTAPMRAVIGMRGR